MIEDVLNLTKKKKINFHPDHWADLIKSGLSEQTISSIGVYSVPPADISRALGWNPKAVTSVLAFPYAGTNGFCRYKVFPAFKDRQGHTVKYLQKKNTGSRLYILPSVSGAMTDAAIPLAITEGEKKTAALVQAGVTAIGVGGVWCWRDSKTNKAIQDFDEIAWKGRQAQLYFDSDVWARPDLLRALYSLGKELEGRGALIQAVVLEPIGQDKIGIDDFLVANDASALETLKAISVSDRIFAQFFESGAEVPKGFGVIGIGEIKEPRMRWLIKDILPKGVLAFISAKAKHGKSTLATHIATCLSTAQPFLGRYQLGRKKPYKVLYILLEDHPGEFKAKVKCFLKGKKFPNSRFKILKATMVSLPKDLSNLQVDFDAGKYDLIILDTLRRSHESEEDSSSNMAPIINGFRALVNKLRMTILIIHHAGHKIEDGENPANYLRGTSDLNGAWETLLGLHMEKGSVTLRAFHRYRSSVKIQYKVIRGQTIDKSTGDYPIVDLVYFSPEASQYKQNEEKVKNALANGPQSGNKLEHITGLPRAGIDAALAQLSEQGKVKQDGKGKNRKWCLIP